MKKTHKFTLFWFIIGVGILILISIASHMKNDSFIFIVDGIVKLYIGLSFVVALIIGYITRKEQKKINELSQ